MGASRSPSGPARAHHAEHNRYQRWYYEHIEKKTMQPASTTYVLRHVERLAAHGDLADGHRILEIGCGLGRYTLPLLDRGLSLTAVDLSPVMLGRLARAARGRPLELLACDVAEIDRHTRARFDRAVGCFTLHHMHDLEAVFSGLARVLDPGAVVAFLEPVWFNPLYYAQILLTPGMTFRGEHGLPHMRLGRVGRALRDSGFERVSAHPFGYLPPFLMNNRVGPSLEAALARVPLVARMNAFQIFRAERAAA